MNRADGAIDRAILSTLPTGPGQRNRYIFNLARQLKSIPGLTEADPKELERHVRDWHARALPVIRTKDFAETFSDFIGAWRKCEPSSADPLGRAIARARQISAGLPERAADLDGKKRLLALFCRELQRETGAAPFFLSTRTVARLFDVASPMLAGRMLKCLETLDFIRCVEKGKPGGKRASRFRWLHPLG